MAYQLPERLISRCVVAEKLLSAYTVILLLLLQDRASSARAKPMPATATTMVRSIWQNYFYSMDERDDAVNKQKAEEAAAQGVAQVSRHSVALSM